MFLSFQADVLLLIDAFEQVGNPFLEDSGHLIDLESSIIMSEEVVQNTRNVVQHGQARYNAFVENRLSSQKEAFTDSILLAKLKLFQDKSYTARKPTDIRKLKNENKLNTRINKAIQARRDTSELLSHESSSYRPSLTKNGGMYHGTKSELLGCLLQPA